MATVSSTAFPVRADFADALAWVNDDRSNTLEGYRPGWDDGHVPTPEEDAYWAGFTLGLETDSPVEAPSEMDVFLQIDFYQGHSDGRHARWQREDEEREYNAWLDQLEAERLESAFAEYDAYHDSEVVEAIGCIAARKLGGGR